MAKRTYESDSIRVFWDSDICVHVGLCFNGLPEAFDREARPWVDVNGADADAIAAQIEQCPSGALRYERLDGAPQEDTSQPVSIMPMTNGPLYVRGSFTVQDRKGNAWQVGPRAALCRCGKSQNAPFCDTSHREEKFRSVPRAPVEE